jgi:hypothetical protein
MYHQSWSLKVEKLALATHLASHAAASFPARRWEHREDGVGQKERPHSHRLGRTAGRRCGGSRRSALSFPGRLNGSSISKRRQLALADFGLAALRKVPKSGRQQPLGASNASLDSEDVGINRKSSTVEVFCVTPPPQMISSFSASISTKTQSATAFARG